MAETSSSPSSSSSSSSTSTNIFESRRCSTPGCGKAATLKCPTCNQKGLPDSFFCSQDCFKSGWALHKLVHLVDPATLMNKQELPERFHGYQFSGPLRPTKLSPKREVPAHIPRPEYADRSDGSPIQEDRSKQQSFIEVKSKKQIEGMRAVGKIAREILDIGAAAVRPGITTDEIDRIVHEATIARNAYPSPLNYKKFPKSCCTSVNEVICHGIPDFCVLKEGDIVNIDVTAYYGGFHGDLNATYYVGGIEKADEESKRLVETTRECLNKAIEMVRPGALYRDIGNTIQKIAQAKGVAIVRSYCGHGIGEHFHTAPSIPHYGKNKAVGVMKPGHVFTIEPMINLGTWHDETWPDNWTSVTRDGKRSAQFEHTILVTETGYEILTGAPY